MQITKTYIVRIKASEHRIFGLAVIEGALKGTIKALQDLKRGCTVEMEELKQQQPLSRQQHMAGDGGKGCDG